nr:helix-turn-helix transcriptional regulator [Fournierella massiliensis]
MELNRMKIGAAIAARRKEKGLTQEQLAARLGVSAPAVSKWETDTSYPDITLLCPLARALGTSVDALLQFEETLSDEEVVRRVNDLLTAAMNQMPDGWQAAEQQLEELLHQYPGCTALQYNAVASYDAWPCSSPRRARKPAPAGGPASASCWRRCAKAATPPTGRPPPSGWPCWKSRTATRKPARHCCASYPSGWATPPAHGPGIT